MVAKGPATLELKLGLPLKELQDATAKGRIDVTGAAFDYQPAQVQLAGLQGRFDFTDEVARLQRRARQLRAGRRSS